MMGGGACWVEIVVMLGKGDKTAEDIAASSKFSISSIRKNLRLLEAEGAARIVGYQNWHSKSGRRRRRVWQVVDSKQEAKP